MDMLKKFFPFSFNAKDIGNLIIHIIIYLVAGVVGGWVLGLIGIIPFIGLITDLIGKLLGLYCLIGIALAVLDYFKLLK